MVDCATSACTFSTSQLQNVLCATRACTFFHISTSKSALGLRCFVLRNLLRITTACTCSTYLFSLSRILKKLLSGWGWGALYILTLTLKGASCHNCMQLFNSHLHRWLRNRRFSEPTFRPSGILEPQVIGKRQWIYRYFSTFLGPESSFFIFLLLLILSLLSDNFLSSSSLLFPEASTSNCFSICPYCQKFDF